jgi:hypothetical protein
VRTDEEFRGLTRSVSDLWERPIDLPFLGQVRAVRLWVLIDEEGGIEPPQAEAYRDFIGRVNRYMGSAEEAILRYYRSVCDNYRGKMGIGADDDPKVPLIGSVGELARLVTLEGVYFKYGCDKPTCGLLCDCTWEEEHGLGVLFEEGEVTDVGFQDVVL